jgi:hypothetical protein
VSDQTPGGARTITADLLERLRRHYIKPGQVPAGGVFLPEVGWNATGGTSRADALYVGFTSASGRLLVGHEVKASRSDWLSELNKPGKADGWADQCHAWYLVTIPGVVAEGELPPGWGLMHPGTSRTRMKVVTTAHVHRDRTPSWDAARSIMARLDTLQMDARAAIRAEEHAKVKGELDAAAAAEQRWAEHAQTQVQELRTRLRWVEETLGVRLVDDHGPGGMQNGTATRAELADVAGLLAHHTSLRDAARALSDRYGRTDLAHLRQALDAVEAAVQRARDGLPAEARTTYRY